MADGYKEIYMKTTQISGGNFVSSYKANDVFGSDQMPWYASGAGIWNHEWTNFHDYEQDNKMFVNFDYENIENTIGIVTIDFFNRTSVNGPWPTFDKSFILSTNIRTIPSSTTAFFNYDMLESVEYLFKGCPITGEIEPFITSLNALKPNITHKQCFAYCFSASDYEYCLNTYPDWF